jgi:hypothetical protein
MSERKGKSKAKPARRKLAKAPSVRFTDDEMAYDAPSEVYFNTGVVIHGRAAWQNYRVLRRLTAQLDPDVRAAFPDDHAVNETLRKVMEIMDTARPAKRKTA